MTDAPDATPPSPAPTPDSQLAPLINLVLQLSPLISTLASQSGDVKTIATNLGIAEWLPWLGWAGTGVGVAVALRWVYMRALGRGKRWAVWFRDIWPWNRSAA